MHHFGDLVSYQYTTVTNLTRKPKVYCNMVLVVYKQDVGTHTQICLQGFFCRHVSFLFPLLQRSRY